MLQSIEIDNYALIDQLKVQFESGLNVITGETGAGKSIILGALGLVMGKRADSKVLFDPGRKCIVEVLYDISDLDLKWFFEANDLDYDNELIIRRTINSSGKSRAFINDTPVTLEVLQNLNSYILDLHQQFDTMLIQKPIQQRIILDTYAENQGLLTKYQECYKLYKEELKNLTELQNKDKESGKEIDFNQFQLNELQEANLDGLDQQEMESKLQVLNKSEDIIRTYQMASQSLSEADPSVIDQLMTLSVEIDTTTDISDEFKQYGERLYSIIEELRDLASQASQISESVDMDQEEAAQIQSDLDLVYSLQRKHHVQDIESLIQLRNELELKVSNFQNMDQLISDQTKKVEELKEKVIKIGKTLTISRNKAAKSFQDHVSQSLSSLAMPNAILTIEINPLKDPGSNGLDEIIYLFSANKGGTLKPLKDVASGGETSRLALAIKSIMASKSNLPTMVFDEIDSGVSGEIANKMGNILQGLSEQHQVITITHSPQIAAKAKKHFYVYKFDSEERTHTSIKELTPKERINEVATMMSGDPPPTTALDTAKALIGI